MNKIKELAGNKAKRVLYVRQEANDLRIAQREPGPNEVCGATQSKSNLEQMMFS